jgi:hypothetical protein
MFAKTKPMYRPPKSWGRPENRRFGNGDYAIFNFAALVALGSGRPVLEASVCCPQAGVSLSGERWGKATRPGAIEQMAKKVARTESIKVWVTPDMRADIEQLAAKDDRTMSAWMN